MTYLTGSVSAVPSANRDAYLAYSKAHWPLFQRYGAKRLVETWGVDIPKGKVNDFYTAVQAKADDAIAFSWIEWADKAAADQAWSDMRGDPAMQALPEMPFDGSRMIFGGFDPILNEDADLTGTYVQGFLLAVPVKNKAAYADLARQVWVKDFQPRGCLGIVEAWGVDLPHGKQTDFYRAVLAKEDEMPVFSWTAWPDRATCDKAASEMASGPADPEMPEMPFDGMRMMWGGFEVLLDSGRQRSGL